MIKKDKKETCSACGTSPVNHKILFFSQIVDKMMEKMGDIFFSFLVNKKSKKLVDFTEQKIIFISTFLGIIRYDTDMEKATTGRSKVIWEEAARRGIDMKQLVVFGKHIDSYIAKINGKDVLFQSIPIPPRFEQEGYEWVDDKFVFFKKLREAGLPVPATERSSSVKDIEPVFESLNKPIIVKPRFGSRGRHTTTNINTIEEFKTAFLLAKQISPSIIAQEHLFGSVYRATVVDGILVGFFKADPPFVVGDGVKTVKELIAEKNKTRNERVYEISINPELLSFIKRYGYEIDSVVPVGETLWLIAKMGRMYGGYTKEMLPEVHPKIHEIFSKAGKLASIAVAGFDFIIPDPTLDPDTQYCGIIECNSLPFIDLHYFPLEGEPVIIAKYVWDLWEEKG